MLMFLKDIKFVHKVSLLVAFLILLSGLGITGVTAYQFRKELYHHEFRSSFTVYVATVNYLTGHYFSKRHSFDKRSLNFVLSQKFLRLDGANDELEKSRPVHLVIYNEEGMLVYEYSHDDLFKAEPQISVDALPKTYTHTYDKEKKIIRAGGPISLEQQVPGYVSIIFLTDIEDQVKALYRKAFAIMGMVVVFSLIISIVFTRRALRPIILLTSAAKKVRAGDLNQQVVPTTFDEIGMLTNTFNDMTSSIVRRIALMHRMQDWAVRISKEFDIDRLYETLMDMFEVMAGTASSKLFIFNEKNNVLDLVLSRGNAAQPQTDDPAVRRVFDTNNAQFIDADSTVSDRSENARGSIFPLVAGNKRVGVIWLGPKKDQGIYDDETITTLKTLIQYAAVAIENTRLYREVAEKERFAREMEWAREIQQSMLPKVSPQLLGYEVCAVSVPALEVGGDYYDYVTSGADQWHFIIGDVSGKGVPAALIMSIVRSLIHTCVEGEPSPQKILSKVNRNLTPDLESEMFVTVAAFSLDPILHKAKIVRAGHEPIMVIRASGQVERLEPRGTAVGILDEPTFDSLIEQSEFNIGYGDTVILYTDGITEAHNRKYEELGHEGLEKLALKYVKLPVKEMMKSIVADVQAFAEGQPQHDDITIVIIRRNAAAVV